MNSYVVSIVGAGAASLSFVNSLSKMKLEDDNINLVINIFDNYDRFGRGNAYESDLNSNIMNTKASYLTYDEDKPRDFLNWLEKNNFSSIHQYTDTSYVPRSLFGHYMQEKWEDVTIQSAFKKISINKINCHIVSIRQKDDKFELTGENDECVMSDYVILASGTSIRKIDPIYHNLPIPIIDNPYPACHLFSKVGNPENVVVIGARLSTIDSVIALKESGYSGKIIMHCINGTFPTVRGIQGRYENKFLSYGYISSNYKNNLTFEDVVELFRLELENYRHSQSDFDNEDMLDLMNQYPISDLSYYLDREITLSKMGRAWQAIFYDTNRIIPLIWSLMERKNKTIFLDKLLNKLTALRVSIPVENAIKIQSYIKDGALIYSSGSFRFDENESGVQFISDSMKDDINIGAIIFATGSPANPVDSNSILSNQLIYEGILTPCEWGGVCIDNNYHPYNSSGEKINNFFIIGELTRGRDMFVAALDIIRRQAHECALSFISAIQTAKV